MRTMACGLNVEPFPSALHRSIATHNLLWKHRFRGQQLTTISPLVLVLSDSNPNNRLCLAYGNVKGELGVQTVGRAGPTHAVTDIKAKGTSAVAIDVDVKTTTSSASIASKTATAVSGWCTALVNLNSSANVTAWHSHCNRKDVNPKTTPKVCECSPATRSP